MLKLKDITKVYEMGETKVEALKGVSLCFRRSEFVSILGQSGCGKTTMLNIIGGLDRYTNGDLVINGRSTKEYKDKDWDTYRNHSIGFVFQSYNLIPHQTVLENVELALTLSGVSKHERRKKAIKVLEKVGLGDKLKNKPSQLSGGQMQRVAIARALVNDPEIILADEPTGALDTETSVQIMEILKEISKDKLIIMVTHNPELAEKYSTRIVNLLDGNLVGDSNPYTEEEEQQEVAEYLEKQDKKRKREKLTDKEIKKREKKKRMSFWTALSLSFKNLLTKKARTILVAFAGSIGIIGISLILAVSSGFSTYINKMQEDTLSTSPITIKSRKIDFTSIVSQMFLESSVTNDNKNPDDGVYVNQNISTMMNSIGSNIGKNNLEAFYEYIEDNYDDLKDYVTAVQCTYDLGLEFYLDQENVMLPTTIAVEPDPYNRALLTMITKYALFFFEDKTGISATPIQNGGYVLHRPTTLPENEYYNGESNLEKRKAAYPFVYDNNYSSLYNIIERLEDPVNNGDITLSSQQEVLGLVFGVFDADYSDFAAVSGSSSMLSMFGSMNIFNEMIDNEAFIKSQYDLLAGEWINYDERHANEAYLVLDSNNELDDYILYGLGLLEDTQMEKILKGIVENKKVDDPIDFDKIIGQTYKVLDNVDYFVLDEESGDVIDFRLYTQSIQVEVDNNGTKEMVETNPYYDAVYGQLKYMNAYKDAYKNCTNEVKIVGVVRTNENTKSGSLSTGVAYTKFFTQQMIDYRNEKIDTDGIPADSLDKINVKIPNQISLYIKSFESKEGVVAFIDAYNAQAEKEAKITYTDVAGFIMSTVSTIINAITYVLIAFVSVSLIVSSIMIGIITYISVIERTKEIGVLRSVGASKRDVKRVFTAESFIIGLASGVLGIAVSLLLIIPINLVLGHFTGISGLARLPWAGAIILILISVFLTFISGLIPAKAAAKKDPVIALREN